MVHSQNLKQGHMGPERSVEMHNQQVRTVKEHPRLATAYGVKQDSVFVNVGSFHSIRSLPSDIPHDIYEGVGKSLVTDVLQHCLDRT